MSEWHITPDYIVNNWTSELLNLMIEKLVERKKRERGLGAPGTSNSASLEELAINSRGFIKVVRKNGD